MAKKNRTLEDLNEEFGKDRYNAACARVITAIGHTRGSITAHEMRKIDIDAGEVFEACSRAIDDYKRKHTDFIQVSALDAMYAIKKAMSVDSDHAWAWHCNLAMAGYDTGLTYSDAHEMAAGVMRLIFGVDTSKYPKYRYHVRQKE